MNPLTTIKIKEINDIVEIYPLRQKVLRPNQPIEASQYSEDKHPKAMHVGAYDKNNLLIGIASLHPSILTPLPFILDNSLSEKIGWRLRGMAVEPAFHGQKVGTTLLNACYEYTATQSETPRGIWCNARSLAVPYYIKNGWTLLGEEFEIADAGPHFVMLKSK